MASNGRITAIPATTAQALSLLKVFKTTSGTILADGDGLQGCADRRVAMDGDREPTGTYLRRVGMALQASAVPAPNPPPPAL